MLDKYYSNIEKGSVKMKYFEHRLSIKNPFKMYRYVVPSAYRSFHYSVDNISLRPDNEDSGYDDVTDIKMLYNFPLEIALRIQPFITKINKEFFIENHNYIDFNDCLVSQEWAVENQQDDLILLDILRNKENVKKVKEEEFLDKLIFEKYDITKEQATFNNIESFDIMLHYYYNRHFNKVGMSVENIIFKDGNHNERANKKYDSEMYVPDQVIEYYYNIDPRNRHAISEILEMEYSLTPAMILHYELFNKIKYKIINVIYDSSNEE
jgi:hypothetical protein